MTKDWVQVVSHSPICQILLQNVMRGVITSSPPAWTSSAGMLSTPADFPFFSDCTVAFTSLWRMGWSSSVSDWGQFSTDGSPLALFSYSGCQILNCTFIMELSCHRCQTLNCCAPGGFNCSRWSNTVLSFWGSTGVKAGFASLAYILGKGSVSHSLPVFFCFFCFCKWRSAIVDVKLWTVLPVRVQL